MLDLSFFLGPLLESTSGHWLSGQEERKNFENDVKLFLEKQKQDTSLDIFFFANRPEVRDDKEYLNLEDIYIPIRLKQIRESMLERGDFLEQFDHQTEENSKELKLPDNLTIAHLLKKMHDNNEDRKVMLIGNGGSGKSTFLKYLARFFSEKNNRQIRVLPSNGSNYLSTHQNFISNQYFPIFIRLRDLEQILYTYNKPKWEENFSIIHFLKYKHGLKFTTNQFYAKIIQQLPCLILLDGVDEVPEYKEYGNGVIISRRKIMSWINTQAKVFGSGHSETSFIITSRPADLSILARSFQVYELNSFSEAEIKLFTDYWYKAYEKMLHYCLRSEIYTSRKSIYQRKIELLPQNKASFLRNLNNPHLIDLINNPLLLSQAVLIHSVDESFEISDIDSLYEKFINTLLYRWDDVRQMNFFPELLGNRNLKRLFQLMGRIAFAFAKREVTKMTFEDLLPEVVRSVSRFKSSLLQPDKIVELSTELLEVLRDRGGIFTGGIIAEDRNQTEFEFQHKSFQDYLAAYTLASDSGLWQADNFDLFTVIDRREFWGRTLEFFVNIRNGNPDGFFRSFLEHLEPETLYAKKLNHFVQYYFLAQEKEEELEQEIIKKCEQILLESPNCLEIQLAQFCLNKLSFTLNHRHLEIVKKNYYNLADNFRAVKLAQLFYIKGRGAELLPTLREVYLMKEELDTENGLFYRFRHFCFLGLLQRDFLVWKSTIDNEKSMSHFSILSRGLMLALLDWLDWRGLLALRDSRALGDLRAIWTLLLLREWRYLKNLRAVQDLRILVDLADLLNWRILMDLWDLKDLRNWPNLPIWPGWPDWRRIPKIEQMLIRQCQEYTQNSYFEIFFFKFNEVNKRFHALTPEQKRQYFINVDE